jgi:hypothetical protein
MNRLSLLIATGAIVTACGGEDPLEPVGPPLPTFVVIGIVRDEAGEPVPGAVAEIPSLGRTTVTNQVGHFSFSGLRGSVRFRVQKAGFQTLTMNLFVNADIAWEVRLFRGEVVSSDSIVLGATIRSTVEANFPACDPNWDALAPCRVFLFTAPRTGRLTLSITWFGEPSLDATLVTDTGTYVATSTESGEGMILLDGFVEAGRTYEIRVNSYYGHQVFDLRADLP